MRVGRRRPVPIALFVLVLVAACGIPRDPEPRLTPGGVVMPAVAPTAPLGPGGTAPSAQETDVAVFLVKAEHLLKAVRAGRRADLTGALAVLLAGPTEDEFTAGIRTAISPQTVLRAAHLDRGTAVVDLSAAFVEVGGHEQILAVAQVVLTATAVPGVGRVRFLLDGQAVDVPRADGTLSSESLGAADYERLLARAP